MIYPADFESRIGFDKIREQVATYLQTDSANRLLDNVRFSSDLHLIKLQTGQTHEMLTILNLEDTFPLTGFKDINKFLHRIEVQGAFLEVEHLVELHTALELLQSLNHFFATRSDSLPYPLLDALLKPVGDYREILTAIRRIVDRHGKVRDNASPELQKIRRSLLDKANQVSHRLQQILRSAQQDGFADPESSVTMRDGRALIPLSAGSKRKIKGFIHGESATGRTAFIEPMEVVELNNEIKELEAAENREIIRILTEFTIMLRPNLMELLEAGDLLSEIEFIIGKARWAQSYDARLPIIEKEPYIYLRQARHPQLEKALKKENKPLVPLDIVLTPEKHILLISGPNAGGKSVCLKTVVLMQYLLQCGFLVTALDNSQMGIFNGMFLDIGDQQSLDNDLSTYSSHLLNMKTILQKADERSLVLIDEFGSGTEPTIGGAIAESILEKLEERRVFGIITTHYANLKYYAAAAKGIINGAMMFDLQKIEPLFRLEMGQAGSSFAFEISRKIGLPEEIIAMATEKVGVEQIDIERQLRDATRDKRYWERKRQSIRLANRQAEDIASQYEKELKEIHDQRKQLIRKAEEEAKRIVSDANRTIEKTIREIRESEADRERTREVRSELHQFIENLESSSTDKDESIQRKIELLSQREERRKARQEERAEDETNNSAKGKGTESEQSLKKIELGSSVRLTGQQTIGEVISVSGNDITVAFGHLTTQVKRERLELVSHGERKRQASQQFDINRGNKSFSTNKKRLDFKDQLDLRGMRAMEALAATENFIDEAIMLNFARVTILHGKGTGALKQEIREYLNSQPIVKSVYDEDIRMGGAGISVVELDI